MPIRNLIKLCLLAALLVLPIAVQAQFTFTTNSGAINITGYNTAAGLNAVIPASTNGYPVTSIDQLAFYNTAITSLTIPNGVISLGDAAIGYCAHLTNISVNAANPAYSSLNGVLFDKAQATLIQCPGGLGTFTIPNSVTSIRDYAFASCSSLTSVTIGTNVTNIGIEAFISCRSLTSVIIPNSVTSIADYAFASCSSLTSVTIGTGVTTLGNSVFTTCDALTAVYFLGNAPSGVNSPYDTSVFVSSDEFSINNPVNRTATAYYLPGTTGWDLDGRTGGFHIFDGIPAMPRAATPPASAISTYGGRPTVFFPAAAGAGYAVQMTTNLATGAWVTVPGVAITGIIVTNAPANAFFRLQ